MDERKYTPFRTFKEGGTADKNRQPKPRPVATAGGGALSTMEGKLRAPKKNTRSRSKLGELLLKDGVIDESALNQALELGKRGKKKLGRVLIEMGLADDLIITRTLAKQLGVPFMNLNKMAISRFAVASIPGRLAFKYLAMPISASGKKLAVAMENPSDLHAESDLTFAAGMAIQPVAAPREQIIKAIRKHYGEQAWHGQKKDLSSEQAPEAAHEFLILEQEKESEKETRELLVRSQLSPIVKLSNSILARAIRRKASDIHIDPRHDKAVVRYRVDGVLSEHGIVEKNLHPALVSRFKIISGMDIAIRRRPQDGKIRLRFDGGDFDLRVSSIPASTGEKIVIRILDHDKGNLRLEDMRLPQRIYKGLTAALDKTAGIILVTGPTGSGKSTTLYAGLNRLRSPEVNIVTVEDPVEYEMEGVSQVQINPKAGLTFASGLRSILRQDPNIIMVGEIRDAETASIAIQAALTGHLVLSTLHTNDAPTSMGRLLDLGAEPFLVASALEAMLAQRLVRCLCTHCAQPDLSAPDLVDKFGFRPPNMPITNFLCGAGCPECHHTGYSGRMGIFELVRVTTPMREAITQGITISGVRAMAEADGYRPMAHDGLRKAGMGLTSLAEVLRVAVVDNECQAGQDPVGLDWDTNDIEPGLAKGDSTGDGEAGTSAMADRLALLENACGKLEKRLEEKERESARQNDRLQKLEWALLNVHNTKTELSD